MYPFLIAGTAAFFFFAVFRFIGAAVMARQLAIRERIRSLQGEKTEKTPLRSMRAKKKRKGTALARTRKQLEKLENELYDVGFHIPARQFLLIWAGTAFGLPALLGLFGLPFPACGGAAVLCAAGPILLLKQKKKKRKALLETQLVEAISVLCNALRAGHSFQQAMSSITEEMEGPVSQEFGRVFRETQNGMTMQDSMERMVERVGSDDLEMLCTAILIQREIGGNLAEVLENIAGTIQNRLTLKTEIKTRTASGRLSGYLVGSLPVALLLGLGALNPEYIGQLFSTRLGNAMLAVGAVMEIIGFIVIRKMTAIRY